MNNLQEYKLSLYERCEAGDITVDERDLLLEAVSDEIDVDEMDTELEEAVSEYLDTIEESFNEGVLTEEEVDILLESLAGKVKKGLREGKDIANNVKGKVKDSINNRYDRLIDNKSKVPAENEREYRDLSDYYKRAVNHVDDDDVKIGKDRNLDFKEKLEKISKNAKKREMYNDNMKTAEKMADDEHEKVLKLQRKKDKSTSQKAAHLAKRDAKKVYNKTSDAVKKLRKMYDNDKSVK